MHIQKWSFMNRKIRFISAKSANLFVMAKTRNLCIVLCNVSQCVFTVQESFVISCQVAWVVLAITPPTPETIFIALISTQSTGNKGRAPAIALNQQV